MRTWLPFVLPLLLAGCLATTQESGSETAAESGRTEQAPTDDGSRPALSTLLADGLPDLSPQDLATDRHKAAFSGAMPAHLPALQAQAEGILQQLRDGLPGAPEVGGIWLRPRRTFHAVAMENGLIVINLGTLLVLEREAELAALIAHELAHVIAGHHDQTRIQAGLAGATDAARAVEIGFSEDLGVDYADVENVQRATNGMLFPAWSRGQERAADRLGMDLLVRAGYNPDAMLGLLQRLESLTPEQAEWSPLTALRAQAALEDPASVDEVEDVIDVAAVREQLRIRLEGTVGADHDSATVRQRLAREYLIEHYATLGPRPQDPEALARAVARDADAIEGYLAIDRIRRELLGQMPARSLREALAAAEGTPQRHEAYGEMFAAHAYRAMGDRRRMLAALAAAVATGEAPYAAYAALLEARLEAGEFDAARAVLTAAGRRFDDPPALLPHAIALHKAAGASLSLLSSRARCLASMDSALIQRCQAAAQ